MDMEKDRQESKLSPKKFSVIPGRDRIGTMMAKQEAFMQTLGIDFKNMPPAERDKIIKECCLAAMVENVELLNEVNWKSWKKTKKPLDVEAARFEIIDDLCFLLEKAIILGMDSEMLFQYFLRKVEINEERQKNSY